MFEIQASAFRSEGLCGLVAIFAHDLESGLAFGKRHFSSFQVLKYGNVLALQGTEAFIGAVLLDPVGERPLIPSGLIKSLARAAFLTNTRPLELMKVYRAGRPVDQYLYDPDLWHCSGCHALRNGKDCWKCGPSVEGYHPIAGLDELQVPDVNIIRELAHAKGYCLAEHGSKERDLDVVAIPWTDSACDADELAQYLADNLLTENGPARVVDSSSKPWGRKAYNIQLNGFYKLIDLSITPKGHDGNS